MSFFVTILGSGAAVPKLSRGTTAQYVSCHNRQILLDCGEGTQLQFRKFKLKFQSLDIILISHLHGDHVFGLPGLISTMTLLGRTKNLKIVGPAGIKKLITVQLDLVGVNKSFELVFVELEKESVIKVYEDKCIEIHTFPLKHRIETQGYLIKEKPQKRKLLPEKFEKYGVSVSYIQKLIQGDDITDNNGVFVRSADVTIPGRASKSYAYCTDTAYDERIIPYIKNADVLYHEATFLNTEADRASKTYHSTAKQAASIAYKAGVKRLVLGHFSARYKDLNAFKEEAETIFEPTFIPNDGDIFYI